MCVCNFGIILLWFFPPLMPTSVNRVYTIKQVQKKDRAGSVTFAFECFEKGKPSLGNFHMRNP